MTSLMGQLFACLFFAVLVSQTSATTYYLVDAPIRVRRNSLMFSKLHRSAFPYNGVQWPKRFVRMDESPDFGPLR
ncbi:hypothetical protein M3Y96_00688300 [Aphelenchoides besseyi]|nr:hypothetical protein M3Y96_00688300 [Aphelenchoides besseyi]